MAYSITVESYFSAAHRLRGYCGKCERLHGHNWRVQAIITGNSLVKPGVILDFKEAKDILEKILSLLDHNDLNKLSFFKTKNPTSELIAEFIFNEYAQRLKKPIRLKSISVWETPNSSATFSEEEV